MEKKIYISCDMEGCAGVTSWEQTHYGHKGYDLALKEMTRETVAAVKACQQAGYQVTVKDGHEDGINLDPALLPAGTELIQGWDSSPEEMMAGISADYAGAIHIGSHSPAGSSETPLDHTVEHGWYSWVKLNGELASEFTFNSLCAAQYGVPSLFLAGDAGICRRAEDFCPGIVTYATKKGVGSATVNMSPQEVEAGIATGIKEALAGPGGLPLLADEYLLEFCFSSAGRARAASFYPGAERAGERVVRYRAKSIMELLTAKMFMTEI